MAEQSGFFDAHLTGGEYDRVYLASSFARYFASFIGNGVFADKAAGLMVYQTNPSTMGVKVLPGQAWINGYWYENDSEFSLPIDIADGVLNRIDLVVLRWGTIERSINLVVKKGTPASNAVAPVVQRDSDYYELKLAEIHVTAGSTSITQANIVDTRADTNTCGWVTGVIKQVDTAELFAQWQAAYEAAYAETQTYHAEQKAAWERFFANTTEDSVFPVPALEDVGKVPVVNATSDGYELKEFLSLLGGTMKGDVAMGGHKVTGLGNPEEDGDAVPLKYAQEQFAPAGYGLGTTASYRGIETIAELDNIKVNGKFLIAQTAGILSLEGVAFNILGLDVFMTDDTHGEQSVIFTNGRKLRRVLDGNWQPWTDISPSAFAPSGYGLGEHSIHAADCQAITENGWYYTDSSTLNAPPGMQYGTIIAKTRGDAIVLEYTDIDGGRKFQAVRKANGEWDDWVDISPSAFAPAGFGLGGEAKKLTSADDLNNVWQSGNYWWDSHLPANVPIFDKWNNGMFSFMRVDGLTEGIFKQTVWNYHQDNAGQCMTRYCTEEWEWVNPPLIAGVEYRTTERYDGKPVYIKRTAFVDASYENTTVSISYCDEEDIIAKPIFFQPLYSYEDDWCDPVELAGMPYFVEKAWAHGSCTGRYQNSVYFTIGSFNRSEIPCYLACGSVGAIVKYIKEEY